MNKEFGNFRGKAYIYAKYRPKYSKEYSKYLQNILSVQKDSVVVDIGAGTGIHTNVLTQISNKVIAVEPDLEMLQQCIGALADKQKVTILQGFAEDTGLPSACADYITVAQAFHLFNQEKSLLEFKRVLRSNGNLILVWNSKEQDNVLFYDNESIIRKYCPRYRREIHARSFFQDSYKDCFTPESYTYRRISRDSTELLDKQTFIMRTLSASYAIVPEDKNYTNLVEELGQVFDKHSMNGVVEVPQSSVIYHGNIK